MRSCTRRRSFQGPPASAAWRTRAASPAGSADRRCSANEVKTPDEIVALIEAVTADDIRRVARKVFDQDQLSLAIVGPFKSDKRFVPLLKL